MIKTKDLTRNYGDLIAVNNVSFSIARGEIVGLLGHNGAGKTTIMKMLTGYLEPNSGSILIDGLTINEHRQQAQSKIGYLPENCPLYSDMRVIDSLDYVAGLRGLRPSSRVPAISQVIDRLELQGKLDKHIRTLSRGFRQRVGVAQALLNSPDILILDEPTDGLDPFQIQHMRTLLKEIGKKSTVIISTHILQEVEAVCDRVLIVRSGKLVLDSNLGALQNKGRLLVTIDKNPESARTELAKIQDVSNVTVLAQKGQHYQYALQLRLKNSTKDLFHSVPAVVRAILDKGYQLHALYPEKQTLETVFRQINASNNETIGDSPS